MLLGEPDAPAIIAELGDFELRVASRLARLELCRLGLRTGLLAEAQQLIAGVALVPISDDVLSMAETIAPAAVASLDAIHLATVVRLADAGVVGAVVTYDTRLSEGAREHGIDVLAPS